MLKREMFLKKTLFNKLNLIYNLTSMQLLFDESLEVAVVTFLEIHTKLDKIIGESAN